MDTLSDLILHLNYTSREGGERLRAVAREAAEKDFPGEGWCLFDIPHDFADAWELSKRSRHDRDHRRKGEHEEHERRLALRFSRNMFPFVPGNHELYVEKMALLFNRCEHCRCECPGECPCCMDPTPASYEVELERGHGREEVHFQCMLSEHWLGLYHGEVETRIGPLRSGGERSEVRLSLPEEECSITRAYLLCRYKLEDRCPRRKETPPLRCNPCD